MELFGLEEKTLTKYAHSILNLWLLRIASMFLHNEKYMACILL